MTKYDIRKKLIRAVPVDKIDFITAACTAKNVLDLGCIRHSADFALKDPTWLHQKIRNVAKKTVGIDYLPLEIEKLNSKGFDIKFGDVTQPLELKGQFDVIVAGDIIEHLTNFDGFFENCIKFLKPDGILIITTPNPFFSAEFHFVAWKTDYLINPEHTCWIDPQALSQLVSRFNCYIDQLYFINHSWTLGGIILDSESNPYDILHGTWKKNSLFDKLFRMVIAFFVNGLYFFYKLISFSNGKLVRHSDYMAVVKINSK